MEGRCRERARAQDHQRKYRILSYTDQLSAEPSTVNRLRFQGSKPHSCGLNSPMSGVVIALVFLSRPMLCSQLTFWHRVLTQGGHTRGVPAFQAATCKPVRPASPLAPT